MRKVIVIIALMFACCLVSILPMRFADMNAAKVAVLPLATSLSSTTGETGGSAVTLATDEKTSEKTYTTEFSVKAVIQSKQDAEGNFAGLWLSQSFLYDENVLTVELVNLESWYPQTLKISKTTDKEKNYYFLFASFDTWADPNREIYPCVRVTHTGKITYHESAKISGITTDMPSDTDNKVDEILDKVDGLIKDQNSAGLDRLWEIVRPFVVYVLSALMSGVIVAQIISAAIKKKYDTKAIANEVLKNLADKDISVDIETMTKKEIDTIGAALKNNLKDGLQGVENMKKSVALLCNAISKSKILSEEERKELSAEAKKLDNEIVQEVREKVVVRLEKAPAQEENTEKQDGLFDYLGK